MKGDGTGVCSIYRGTFADENFCLKHETSGLLSMVCYHVCLVCRTPVNILITLMQFFFNRFLQYVLSNILSVGVNIHYANVAALFEYGNDQFAPTSFNLK